jgi:hypothetical protein
MGVSDRSRPEPTRSEPPSWLDHHDSGGVHPITLLPGIVGMIIKDVGITLILALAASLVVAVAVVPS